MAHRATFLFSVSAASLLIANAAQAQTDGLAPGTAAQQSQPVTDGTPSDGAEDIVITGVRASIVGALNVKRNATQIVDSIVAEDVGKLPDNNVVEALQRVTGVQVTDRGNAEAGALSIRGLTDPLTTMNGRIIFTTTGQSFALQDIPANLVKRVDVYKTRAADQIETGLAGQIDVFTRRPFDFDGFAISGVARGIYNEQADTFNPNVSGLISNRWETGLGDVGVLVNGSWSRTKFRTMSVAAGAQVPFATENPAAGTGLSPLQRIFPLASSSSGFAAPAPGLGAWLPGTREGLADTPGSTMLVNGIATPYYLSRDAVFSSDLLGERERPSVNAALQWSPNSSSTYTAEFFWSGFRQTTNNSLMFSFVDFWGKLGPNPASTITLYPDSNIIKSRQVGDVFGFNSGDATRARTDSFVYALNGKWDVGNGKIVADAAYQTSKNRTEFIAMRVNRVASRIDVDFNAGDGIPSYNFSDNSQLLDPARWTAAEFYDNDNRDKGSAFTATLDADQSWDYGFFRKIKAGLRYDARNAASDVRSQAADANGGLGANFATLPQGLQYTNKGFFDGQADVPTSWVNTNGYYLLDNTDEIRGLYQTKFPNILTSDRLALTRVFDINEKTMSAYIQGDAQLTIFGRPLNIQAGVRYVDVDTNFTFTDRYAAGARLRGSQATSRLLPSATVRYDLTETLRARFNFGKTLRRPQFGDLNPNFNLTGDLTNVGYGTGSSGNIALRPTEATSYDLGLEWYFDRDSALYATLFRREIDGLVIGARSRVTVLNTGLNTNSFVVNRPENASAGVLKGAEIGLVYFPHYLPSFLDGLGVQGSATFLDSSQNVPEFNEAGAVTGQLRSAFAGVSDFSYNATLAYDRGPVGARLSYVWRKEFFQRNEAALFANPIGVWRRPDKSLDLQLTAKLTEDLGLTFDATNLTKAKQQEYYRFDDAGNQTQYNLGTLLIPRTFAIGVRYTFD
ncbi:TonB-dependent receptor [Sphingomonas sp. Leaf231]|uniref:TonB-dependent receptor n=1 Tax=Sphingomonas sp. Leaf231 TaxID=1736301 RepID=UPI0006F42E54|nr:TonB-dependent receptor [Sphingomonas sp. Leaf231]KQN90918.1 TonB-dependent receptor [Sphingomonas sp. Leaf231]